MSFITIKKIKVKSNSKYNKHSYKRIILWECDNENCTNVIKRKYTACYLEKSFHYCSGKCSANSKNVREKTSKFNMEKYGNICSLHGPEIKEKTKQTFLNKHGVDHNWKSEESRGKMEQTMLDRYGVKHPMHSVEIVKRFHQTKEDRHGDPNYNNHDKFIETNLERYGVKYPSQLEEFRVKQRQTNMDKYGVENPMQNPEITQKVKDTKEDRYGDPNYNNRDKFRETNIERYGVEYPIQLDEFKDKRIETNMGKYGVPYPMQNEEIKDKMKSTWSNKPREEIKEIYDRVMKTKFKNGYGRLNVEVFSTKLNESLNCRSSYEKLAIEIFDLDDDIVSFLYEPFSIDYYYDYGEHSYYPDFLVEYVDGTQKLIEVKPINFMEDEKNICKFEAARKYCLENGYTFEIWTEDALNL